MELRLPPFSLQLPSGYQLATLAAAAELPSVSSTRDVGELTARAGDAYRLSDLVRGAAPAGQAIAGYRVALSGEGDGALLLNGVTVGARSNFTADEFARLTYTAGSAGSQQRVIVVAQSGKRLADGRLTHIVDSQAAVFTARVTGTRSVNAMHALVVRPAGADGDIGAVASEAFILGGVPGSSRPTLQTVGNFTGIAGDKFRLSDLFHAKAANGQAIASYRVALGEGSGTLWLNGSPIVGRTSFTAEEFARLGYVAGAGGAQDLVVVAQVGKRLANGTLTRIVDSEAMQVTASVADRRSINALPALMTQASGADGNIASIVSEAAILTGAGSASRPALQTVGNFTAAEGDAYRLGDLLHATAPSGQVIAGYRVALGGDDGGQLLLNGEDVGSRTRFTADEFAHLQYVTGDAGSRQSLVVVAQVGKRRADGTLTHVVDSPAVQITTDVTGARSINAMGARIRQPEDVLDDVMSVVGEASVLTGLSGATRPGVTTDGNFTVAANDIYRLAELFHGTAPAGQTIAGYRVALGDGGGVLLLNGEPVAGRTSFTAEEFAHLTYFAGEDGDRQDLAVVAQTGKRLGDGRLIRVVDSAAVQITASVTGGRSVNAMHALATHSDGADAGIVAVVSEASILTGVSQASRPTLRSNGNFSAAAADTYRLNDLFHASAPAGQTIAGYRVALGAGSGALLLNGQPVNGRSSFTADEFARLRYRAGINGAQDIVVVAQTGKVLANGALIHVTDSVAVHVTASVGDQRSINAMNALVTVPTGADATLASIASEANVLTGASGTDRPGLQTPFTPAPPAAMDVLEKAPGAYHLAGTMQAGTEIPLASYYSGSVAAYASLGHFTSANTATMAALLLLGGGALGAFQVAGDVARQSQAIRAYTMAGGW